MGFYQLVSMLPGRLPDCGVHRLMALVWRNYFDPSSSAPPPERSWLDDIRSKPMLDAPCDGRSGSVLIERDSSGSRHAGIGAVRKPRYLGPTVDKLFTCYPDVRQVVLEEAGYLPWLQSLDAFRGELYAFFDC